MGVDLSVLSSCCLTSEEEEEGAPIMLWTSGRKYGAAEVTIMPTVATAATTAATMAIIVFLCMLTINGVSRYLIPTRGFDSRTCMSCRLLPCCCCCNIIRGSLPLRLKYDVKTSAQGKICLLSTLDWRLTTLLPLSCFKPPKQLILSAESTSPIISLTVMPDRFKLHFWSIISISSSGMSRPLTAYSSIFDDILFSTILISSTAFAATAGSIPVRYFISLALVHASSKLLACSIPNESVDKKSAALPLLLSMDIM